MLHTKLVNIGKVVLEKKILTQDEDDNGHQPIATGHLSVNQVI